MAVAGFALIGLPLWFMYTIGILEVLGAVGLWFPWPVPHTRMKASFVILIGAVITTFIFVSHVRVSSCL